MALHQKTLDLIKEAYLVLSEYNPMTLRQVYYQLVSKQVIENKKSEYQRLDNALIVARKEGLIPYEWIEDRTRRPRDVAMWEDLSEFIEDIRYAYRKNIWSRQKNYIVVWVEKEALSEIFSKIVEPYGVTLVVGRGYNSLSIKKELADRFKSINKSVVILYFGDFDPSGEDIYRDLVDSFSFFGTRPKIEKVALTREQVEEYHLPFDFTKKTDARATNFIKKYGDMAVELDALPVQVLQKLIKENIEKYLDAKAFNSVIAEEEQELAVLDSWIKNIS
jgi:hypothetical protein